MKSGPDQPLVGAAKPGLQSGSACAVAVDDWVELEPTPGVADLAHTVHLLSLIADDEAVCLENRGRVIEALQNHGHLLCDEELEVLREWLGDGPGGGPAAPRTHPRPLRLRNY